MNAVQTIAWFLGAKRTYKTLGGLKKSLAKIEESGWTIDKLLDRAERSLSALQRCQNVTKKHRKHWGDDLSDQREWADLRLFGPYISDENTGYNSDSIEVFGSIPTQAIVGFPWAGIKKNKNDSVEYTFVLAQRLDSMPMNYSPTGAGYPYLINFVHLFSDGPVKIQWFCTIDKKGGVHPPILHGKSYRQIRKKGSSLYVPEQRSRIYDPVKMIGFEEGIKDPMTSARLTAYAFNIRNGVDLNVTVRVSDKRGVVNMSIPMEDAKDLFSERRKVKTKTGRSKPILHWVASHKRVNGSNVKTHWRGLRVFEMNGLNFEIYIPGAQRGLQTKVSMTVDSGVGWIAKMANQLKTNVTTNPYSGEHIEYVDTEGLSGPALYYKGEERVH